MYEQIITGYAVGSDAVEDKQVSMMLTLFAAFLCLITLGFSFGIPRDEKMKQLMSNVSIALNNNETSAAKLMYIKLRNQYNNMSKGNKKKYHDKCMQLYERLVNQMLAK